MTTKSQKKPKQNKRDSFEETAKRLECDEDKAAFEAKLGKIAGAKPAAKTKAR